MQHLGEESGYITERNGAETNIKSGAEKARIKKKRKALEIYAGKCEKLEKFFKRGSEGDNNGTGKLAV